MDREGDRVGQEDSAFLSSSKGAQYRSETDQAQREAGGIYCAPLPNCQGLIGGNFRAALQGCMGCVCIRVPSWEDKSDWKASWAALIKVCPSITDTPEERTNAAYGYEVTHTHSFSRAGTYPSFSLLSYYDWTWKFLNKAVS